jgi:flagellar biogenesis protein FliO
VQRLTAQHTVHLLELEGRRLLVATSPQGTQLLSEWPSSSGDTPDV